MDLQKSNATWLVFWRRIFAVFALAREKVEQRDRVAKRRLQARLASDPKGNTDGEIVVAGNPVPGVNASRALKLFVRVTEGSDPRTVSWYRATGAGGGDLVAQGTGNAGTTVTMVEQNDSGISGAHPIAAAITADDDDEHVIELYADWRAYFAGVFDGTDPEGEDLKSLQAIGDTLDRMEELHGELVTEAVNLLVKLFIGDAENRNERPYGSKFLRQAFVALLTDSAEVDGSGAVSRRRGGALEALRSAMEDEATGSTQTIVRRVVAAAAAVAASSNTGQLTLGSHTPEPHMPTGVVTLKVEAGLGTGAGGSEELSVSWASDVDDRTRTYTRRMRIGQSYRGEDGFGGTNGITPQRVFTKTGDGSDLHLNDLSSGWSVANESEQNTAAGDLTVKVVGDGSNFIFEFYRSSNTVSGELVARSPAVAAGAAFVATPRNQSRLQINGVAGSAPVDGTTVTLHLNFLVLNDSWTIAVTLSSEGLLSRLLSKLPILGGSGYRLHGAAAGAELLSDDYVRANTFPAFSAEDN